MAKAKVYTRRQVIGTMTAAVATTAIFEASAAEAGQNAQQAQAARVSGFSFGWNTKTRNGILYLYLENGSTPATINVSSADEFAGYLAILKESHVVFDSNGWLHTGTRHPG